MVVAEVADLGIRQGADSVKDGVPRHHRPESSVRIVPLKAPGRRATPGINFLGLTFDALRVSDAARLVLDQAATNVPFVYVATPNVDHRVRLRYEPGLRSLYESAWMTLCDSRVIELLAQLDGVKLHAAPGADLVECLFKSHIRPDDPINVIGSSEDVIATLRARFHLTNLRWHRAPMDLRNRPGAIAEAAAFVANNPAGLTFICVGSPQQELVAQAIVARGDARGVGLCCGASLEFLSGKVARAPRWMRNIALEWLHRLATDPFRFGRRYLIDGPAIFPIWWESRQQRIGGSDVDDGGKPANSHTVEAMTVHPAA